MPVTLPSVSVIVPFYNIPDSISYCLDSLSVQDYGGALEVVCVDDGSTDATGRLLDAYACGRDGLVVLHKGNGGLSDARNFGVSHSTGEYITFVDGDDLVAPWYVSHLVEAMKESGCSQAVGRSCPVEEEALRQGSFDWPDESDCIFEVRSESDHVARTLYGDPFISACGHLAPRDLYLENPFPKGLVYEDTFSFGRHVIGQENFAVLKEPTYGYVERADSITKRVHISLVQAEQFRAAIRSLQDAVRSLDSYPESALVYRSSLEYARLLNLLSTVRDDDSEAIDGIRKEARDFIAANLFPLLRDGDVPKGDKLRFICSRYAPHFYRALIRIYKKALGSRSFRRRRGA